MKVTKKALLFVLVVAMLFSSLSVNVFALSTSDTSAYPFRTGNAALANAPTAIGATESSDTWQWFEGIFDAKADLTAASYVAVEIKVTKGNPGLNFGVIGGGSRWGIYLDYDEAAYFVSAEDGSVTAMKSQYESFNMPTNTLGMLLLPIANLTKPGWDNVNGTLANATSIYFTTNALFNRDFEIVIGEIGYYTGDPANGGTFTKLLDLTNGLKKTKYVFSQGLTGSFPGEVDSKIGAQVEYPFTTGEYAFKNATVWAGPSAQYTGDGDNWQTVKAVFDNGVTDLSKATYLAVQYFAKLGAPGLTYGLESTYGATRQSIVGHDGARIYMIKENGEIIKTGDTLYAASNVYTSGALLIPMTAISTQWGEQSLAEMTQLVMTTNSRYNWAFEVGFGEIGYYTGEIGYNDFTYHQLVAFDNVDKSASFTVTADKSENAGRKYVHKIDRTVYGDATLFFFGTGKQNGALVPWDGGAAGTQTMTTDTYGDEAVTLVCDGAREGADAYTAFTIFDGSSRDISTQKGFTFWAKNDSDVEVSFNLEVDCTGIESRKDSIRRNARFNIKQGNRFWLYDVNTGKQTIYMTRPCVTLPVGFEGWVRIPYSAFAQAEWDADAGAVQPSDFMTEGTTLTYIGITIYSGDYTGKAFSINKLGTYSTTPSFTSALVPASSERKNIATLMGLN